MFLFLFLLPSQISYHKGNTNLVNAVIYHKHLMQHVRYYGIIKLEKEIVIRNLCLRGRENMKTWIKRIPFWCVEQLAIVVTEYK